MKNTAAVCFVVLLCLGLNGCAGKKDSPDEPQKEPAGKEIALHMKSGGVMAGKLIRQTDAEYVIDWKGRETVVYAEQVERVEDMQAAALNNTVKLSDEEITAHWPYQPRVVMRLNNNDILAADISRVSGSGITVRHSIGTSGFMEQTIDRAKLDHIICQPVNNESSTKKAAALKKTFPRMKFYQSGNCTLITDSYITWVNEYKKVIADINTGIYLNYFPLLRDKTPRAQNFIVIFDDYRQFVEHAVANGVPGWAVAGYFDPHEEVLYLYNYLGDKISELLFEAIVGESGRTIDDIAERVQSQVNDEYKIFIEGQARQIKNRFWQAYHLYKEMYRQATMDTLRHEFTHEALHNWGLQTIALSQEEKNAAELVKLKKEFLETTDRKKKAQYIKGLISFHAGQREMKVANSWLVEGTATNFETEDPGGRNDRWLYLFQEMSRKNAVYPLEALAGHKMGSFPGVCSDAMLELYAQSWAFVNFLTARYPEEFMKYQGRILSNHQTGKESIPLLLEDLGGKNIKTVEQEFLAYMNGFEPVEDPVMENFMRMLNIFWEN